MSNPRATIDLPSAANQSGRSFGAEELELLRQVIESGTLNRTGGSMVSRLEERFAKWLGAPSCRAVSSGTAAIHAAVAALDPEPGDEIITTPITDMGAIAPILYQTAIPIFADVDPRTYNITADGIMRKITRRTRAVIVTHLFGQMCDMDPILAVCARYGLPVIEDCAQAFGATYKGRAAGTIGTIGAFSLQQGKHMSTGEGGLVVTADAKLARRIALFTDKAWGYGDPSPDHYFLAPNYRMTELQGAVALAQLDKLDAMIARRVASAERLREHIAGVPGVAAPALIDGARHTYWKFPLRIDEELIAGGADAFAARLEEQGVRCSPHYIRRLAFECQVLRERATFGASQFPWVGEHRRGEPQVIYDRDDTPGAVEALARVVVLPWNERYTDEHAGAIAGAIRAAAAELSTGARR